MMRSPELPRSPLRDRANYERDTTTTLSSIPRKATLCRRSSHPASLSSTTASSSLLQPSDTLDSGRIQHETNQKLEALVRALEMERHQEKLRADEEIKQLRQKLAQYESSENTLSLSEDSKAPETDNELAECLKETLALLEEEFEEWQNASEPSLLNVSNQLLSSPPSPQKTVEEIVKATPSVKTPSEKLIRSINRLRTVQSQFKTANERKSLALAFDKESDEDQNSNKEDPLLGLQLLDRSEGSIASLESLGISLESIPIPDECNLLDPSLEDLEDEAYALRQQLWNQMIQHGVQVRKLGADHIQQKEMHTLQLQSAKVETRKVTHNMLEIFHQKEHLQKQLKRVREESRSKDAELLNVEREAKRLKEELSEQKEAKDHALGRAKKDLVIQQMQMMWKVAGIKYGTKASRNERESAFASQIKSLKTKLVDTERRLFDSQMKNGLEQNKNASTSMKLEAAMAQLGEKEEVIKSLQRQVEESKMVAKAYAEQAEYLSDELQHRLVEARESSEDRNRSIRPYGADNFLLGDDLASSCGIMP